MATTPALRVTAFLLVLATACSPQATPDTSLPAPPTSPPPIPSALSFDCLGAALDCPQLVIEGDPPMSLPSGEPAPLRGHADASIRRDPTTGDLWMASSYPGITVGVGGARGTRVETHLAVSHDDGETWMSAGVLWDPVRTVSPDGVPGTTDHEVPNLLPVVGDDGGVTWYAARLDLFAPDGAGLGQRPLDSFRIVVTASDTVSGLAAGPTATLGSLRTDPRWSVDVALADLDPALAACDLWNEPALHHADDTLFLALRCLPLGEFDVPDLPRSSLEVFATNAAGPPATWTWRYAGRLAGHSEAKALGGDGLTQVDFAITRDGRLIALVTPDSWSRQHQEFIHNGVVAIEVVSLDPPRLVTDATGAPIPLVVLTASDLVPLGPGAAAYEPTSETGIVLMRRVIGEASLVATLHATGIHP